MLAYITRRILLIIPTLLAIMVVNFLFIQTAPGGPVEQAIANLTGQGADITERVTRSGSAESDAVSSSDANRRSNVDSGTGGLSSKYRGAQGLPQEFIVELEQRYGFDKPLHVRFFMMLKNYLALDFGESYFRGKNVTRLIVEKMPVSISLGVWTTLIVYLVSIPLGIRKAMRNGTPFDFWSSVLITLGTAIPGFLFAVFLLVVFAGGQPFSWFPIEGLISENWRELSWMNRIKDYLWHLVLPITAMTIGGFATLTMLTKNSFLDQINLQYVQTARAKGLSDRRVMYGHVFRNAMLIVIAAFPAAFISVLFTGSVLIETIFSLDGLGLLGFEAVFQRDYPVMFGTLFIFSLMGLLLQLAGDLLYTIIDPRIDFEARAI